MGEDINDEISSPRGNRFERCRIDRRRTHCKYGHIHENTENSIAYDVTERMRSDETGVTAVRALITERCYIMPDQIHKGVVFNEHESDGRYQVIPTTEDNIDWIWSLAGEKIMRFCDDFHPVIVSRTPGKRRVSRQAHHMDNGEMHGEMREHIENPEVENMHPELNKPGGETPEMPAHTENGDGLNMKHADKMVTEPENKEGQPSAMKKSGETMADGMKTMPQVQGNDDAAKAGDNSGMKMQNPDTSASDNTMIKANVNSNSNLPFDREKFSRTMNRIRQNQCQNEVIVDCAQEQSAVFECNTGPGQVYHARTQCNSATQFTLLLTDRCKEFKKTSTFRFIKCLQAFITGNVGEK